MSAPEPNGYLEERGFSQETVATLGWRVGRMSAIEAKKYGIHEGVPAIGLRVWAIPYRGADGQEFMRLRLIDDEEYALIGGGKYRQPAGRELALYDPFRELDRDLNPSLDVLLLGEGEANIAAIRQAVPGLPVVGIPGQGSFKAEFAAQVAHVGTVFLWVDRHDPHADRNIERIAARLAAAGVELLRVFEPIGGKDANDILRDRGADALRQYVNTQFRQAPIFGREDGERLLADLRGFIQRFIVLPSEQEAAALALWIVHTHAVAAADATPYLTILSPEKRAGKTRLLEVIEHLVARRWRAASTSPAALYRKIEAHCPTLLLDEVDAIFTGRSEQAEALRGLLNAGNRRGSYATRCVGEGSKQEAKDFSVFCPRFSPG